VRARRKDVERTKVLGGMERKPEVVREEGLHRPEGDFSVSREEVRTSGIQGHKIGNVMIPVVTSVEKAKIAHTKEVTLRRGGFEKVR